MRRAAACPAARRGEAAEAEAEEMRAELVQTRARILRTWAGGPGGGSPAARAAGFLRSQAAAELSVEERAALLVPAAWFHVPKTGTSICNTFYHTPAICSRFPQDLYVSNSEEDGGGVDSGSWDTSWGLRGDLCDGVSDSYGVLGDVGAPPHEGIGGWTGHFYRLNRGHFVTMLRQPEQRVISQYYYYGAWASSLREYVDQNAGCTVRMLTMDGTRLCGDYPLPTSEDVSVAINVLKEGFAFVGLTEQWDLSVCLFRAMFGGQCLSSDFVDTRAGDNSNTSGYDTSVLDGWVDVWDGPLYAEALSMFESTRIVYGVDPNWCASFCQGEVH